MTADIGKTSSLVTNTELQDYEMEIGAYEQERDRVSGNIRPSEKGVGGIYTESKQKRVQKAKWYMNAAQNTR